MILLSKQNFLFFNYFLINKLYVFINSVSYNLIGEKYFVCSSLRNESTVRTKGRNDDTFDIFPSIEWQQNNIVKFNEREKIHKIEGLSNKIEKYFF
jgi:hypothetical protein